MSVILGSEVTSIQIKFCGGAHCDVLSSGNECSLIPQHGTEFCSVPNVLYSTHASSPVCGAGWVGEDVGGTPSGVVWICIFNLNWKRGFSDVINMDYSIYMCRSINRVKWSFMLTRIGKLAFLLSTTLFEWLELEFYEFISLYGRGIKSIDVFWPPLFWAISLLLNRRCYFLNLHVFVTVYVKYIQASVEKLSLTLDLIHIPCTFLQICS